jgi:hypothetical protein
MSNPDSRTLDCPSAQAGAKDARVYGVRTGTPDAPRVGYLTETLPVSEKLLALSGPAKATEVFRIAAPCAMSGCKHFKENACTLVQRIVEGLAPVVNALPPCQIRSTCRWFSQEGRNACLRCPQVITDKPNATAEEKRIADDDWGRGCSSSFSAASALSVRTITVEHARLPQDVPDEHGAHLSIRKWKMTGEYARSTGADEPQLRQLTSDEIFVVSGGIIAGSWCASRSIEPLAYSGDAN